MDSPATYLIHDNGGRPFKVIVNSGLVEIYKQYEDDYELVYSPEPILLFTNFTHIFIGRETEHSIAAAGRSCEFIGNSILIHLEGLKYVCITSHIYEFEALANIISYESTIYNSDVSYPVAVDVLGNKYLLNFPYSSVILTKPIADGFNTPYDYFYSACDILKSPAEIQNQIFNSTIKTFIVGGTEYNFFRVNLNADEEYNRLMEMSRKKSGDAKNAGLQIELSSGELCSLDKAKYVDIMNKYCDYLGFDKLFNIKLLQDRL